MTWDMLMVLLAAVGGWVALVAVLVVASVLAPDPAPGPRQPRGWLQVVAVGRRHGPLDKLARRRRERPRICIRVVVRAGPIWASAMLETAWRGRQRGWLVAHPQSAVHPRGAVLWYPTRWQALQYLRTFDATWRLGG